MKKKSLILVVMMVVTLVLGMNMTALAKAKIAAPKSVKVSANTYSKYVSKHYEEMTAKGYDPGNGNDVFVSWKKVSGADGYQVKITWLEEGMYTYKSSVNVKKSGKKYIFTTNDVRKIANSTKSYVYSRGGAKQFTSKKLAFFQEACGSCVDAKKVQIRSYKLVNGKKVYSSYKTKKVK